MQTKKLNKSSSFSIATPTGTAGIRGTQFQMAMSPNTGMKLDVAESQVAFTPAGQAQPIVVGPGKGLDASPSGQITQRPISTSASVNISSKNKIAESAGSSVTTAVVIQANEKADKASDSGGDTDSGDESDSGDGVDSVIKNSAATNLRVVSGQESGQIIKQIIEEITSSSPRDSDDKFTLSDTSDGQNNSIDSGVDPGNEEEDDEVPSPPTGFQPDPPVDGYTLSLIHI